MEIGLTFMANKSPQIIKLLDWEDNKDQFVMVMERPMPSMDLRSFVKLHGERPDEGTARKVIRQAIEAANVCIKRSVFHPDIKMENLLVNQDTMQVKLQLWCAHFLLFSMKFSVVCVMNGFNYLT